MPRNRQNETAQPELQERVVFINRVSKTVKGGRRMSLSALVVVGDGKGIQKGIEDAKKNMFYVPVTEDGTIPHEVEGHFGAGRVVLKPAVPGTGIIAGGPVRALCELAGIKNILGKSLGTSNAMNILKAAAEGFSRLESNEAAAARRGISVAQMFVGKEA